MSSICNYCANRCSVNPVDVFGCTPLDNALQQKHKAIVALLEKQGGKLGSDVTLQTRRHMALTWSKGQAETRASDRCETILQTMPERVTANTASAVCASLCSFLQVRQLLSPRMF